MDDHHFDVLAKTLVGGTTRRGAIGVLAGGALAAVLTRLGIREAAAACKDIGKKCGQNADCCSRRCRGKRGKKTCKVGADACPDSTGCGAAAHVCGTEPGGGDCLCKPTVEGNNACIGFIEDCNVGGGFECTSTAQCVRERGPRFVCQKPIFDNGILCGCGQVCLPECEG